MKIYHYIVNLRKIFTKWRIKVPLIDGSFRLKRGRLPNKLTWRIICMMLIVYIGLTHRYTLFKLHFNELNELITLNSETLTWQYLTIPALKEHFGTSLLYLQQTPPIPNIILGLAMKIFGWPHGTAYFLFSLQAFLSIASTLFMFHLFSLFQPRTYLNFGVAIIFLLSTDLVIMEYNHFGQTIYENLAMFLLLLVIYCYFKILQTGKVFYSALMGILTASLALCRASYSYFFIVPFGFLVLTKTHNKKQLLIAYSIFVLLLHMTWSGKNYIIYRTLSISTSSWKGLNFASGLIKVGMGGNFFTSILSEKDRYPEWFIIMSEEHGLVGWDSPTFHPYLPKEVKQEEERIQALLHNTNRSENSIGQRIISDLYMKAYIRFFFTHPELVKVKFLKSYLKFWEPIRNYGIMFSGPLIIIPQIKNSFQIDRVLKTYLTKGIEKHYLMKIDQDKRYKKSTYFYTIPLLPIGTLVINILMIHIFLPLLLIWGIIYRAVYKKNFLSTSFLFLITVYVYAVIVMNLPDHGENMRFRMSIEPVIWVISTSTIAMLGALLKQFTQALRRITDKMFCR